jgi:hypothetical protein
MGYGMLEERQPVTDAAGNVLGWMSAPDPDEPDVSYFEADRLPKVRRRADIIGQAADLMANEAFSLEETWDAGLAAGLSEADLDAAGSVVLMLEKIEYRYDEH